PRIEVSRDLGRTWKTAQNPAFDEPALTFKRTWHIEAGHASQPKVVWAGTEPAGLFRSDDRGMTWTHVPSLRAHATEHEWSPGARAGRDSIRSRSTRPTRSGSRSESAWPASTTRPTAAAPGRSRTAGPGR